MPEQVTIKELAQDVLAGQEVKDQLYLNLGSWTIKTSSNNSRLIQALHDYFGVFASKDGDKFDLEVVAIEAPKLQTGLSYTIKTPDPGKTKIKEKFVDLSDGRVVLKRLTGMVFMFNADTHLAVGPCLANMNQVVNFINNRLIQLELDQGSLLAHAAGVQHKGRGLALAGFSGMGKSTLALHMMSLGLDFVSNDRLLVRRANGAAQMTGVAKLPRINPGTALNNPHLAGIIPEPERSRFAAMNQADLWELEHKYDVDIARFFGSGRFSLSSELDVLGILNWKRFDTGVDCQQVDLSQRLDLLEAFKKSTGLFFLPKSDDHDYSDEAYLSKLQGVRVYELSGGVDFLMAAHLLLEELKKLEA